MQGMQLRAEDAQTCCVRLCCVFFTLENGLVDCRGESHEHHVALINSKRKFSFNILKSSPRCESVLTSDRLVRSWCKVSFHDAGHDDES